MGIGRLNIVGALAVAAVALAGHAGLPVQDAACRGRTTCEGLYKGHLQGVATDGESLYWSFTVRMVKTDMTGRIIVARDVPSHHGDLCCAGGRVYVAVNRGRFNQLDGAVSEVRAYDCATLEPAGVWALPDMRHGAGGMTCRDGRFYVIGGLPPTHEQNHVYEYSKDFKLLGRHDLDTGFTLMGIQTAEWDAAAGRFLFGIYGCRGNPPGVIATDADLSKPVRYVGPGNVALLHIGGRLFVGGTRRMEGGHTGWIGPAADGALSDAARYVPAKSDGSACVRAVCGEAAALGVRVKGLPRDSDGGLSPAGASAVSAADAERMNSGMMNPGSRLGTEENVDVGKFKVLVYGNSIALHGPKADIGWTNNWGMAASAREKDFAHLVVSGLEAKLGKKADFRIRNLAVLERNFKTNVATVAEIAADVNWRPDYVVVAIGENVPNIEGSDAAAYRKFLHDIARPFVKNRARVVMRSPFWRNDVKAGCTKEAAIEAGAVYVDAGHLGAKAENKAIGLFSHSGVANHPGDLGMRRLADLILSGLEQGSSAFAAGAGELRPGEVLSGFAVRSVTPLPEVRGRLVRMTYEKNGADLAWLDRDDDNKTFAIAFRTIPDDDTGVAHIIEHSVLCGSEKYPVKDPFVELEKSSFATYLNAWTGSDRTSYPVCSRNDADFMNLIDVYLDAVFHPLSVKSPLAFRQEGWHYEFKDGELVRNGVVLNEMRGCYGSPDRLAWHMLWRLLFPGNCYGLESGGDPAHIHELTWEKYKDFYRRHYHPSNARIFLDGRVDLAATLARLDAVLSAYPRAEMHAPNPVQEPVRAEKTAEYEIGAEESAADRTLYREGWVYGTFRDRETLAGLDVLTDALADSNEAPLKKALLSRGLCEDVTFCVDCDEQISVLLCVKNVKDGKTGEVRRVVRETLESIAADGVDKARLGALIDRCEFKDREMDYGGFPRGLVFFRRALGQWLYGGDPADAMRSGHIYSGLRAKVKSGWFEDLLRRAVIDNPHRATLTLVPSKALGGERRKAEKAELAAIQAKWTPEEREQVMAECRALDEFRNKAESPEDLARLPRLSLRDIPENGPVPEYSEASVGGVRVVRAKTAANGIAYLRLYFELAGCSGEDLSDASVLSDVLGDLPTARRSVMELKNALDAGLGRFRTSTCAIAKPGDARHASAYLVVSVSALDSKLDEIVRLVPEVLLETSFADANLVGDVVKQRRRGIEEDLMDISGSGFASRRALASQSVHGAMDEHLGGIAFLRRLQRIDDGFAADGAAYCRRLEALAHRVFVRAGLTACLSDNVPTEWLGGLFGRFPEGGAAEPARIRAFVPAREGFRTAGKVGAAAKASFPNAYSGSGCVAANMLSLDYLWSEIRVKGGAYGGGFRMRPFGAARYSSWNDPRPERSLGVYDGSGDALRRLVQDAPSIDDYIISTVSYTEPYLTPSVETSRAAELVLSGRAPDDLRRLRREMLRTTKGDLVRFAGVLDSITNSTSVCVVGGAAQIEACSNLLDRVENTCGATPAGRGGPEKAQHPRR